MSDTATSAKVTGFPAGTLVRTSKGRKRIEDVRRGDMVFTHMGRYRQVTGTTRAETANTVVLSGQGTNGIECAPEQLFYSMDIIGDRPYWEAAYKMMRDRWLKVEEDVWCDCQNVTSGRRNITVYRLEVEEDDSYTIDGIAVHA